MIGRMPTISGRTTFINNLAIFFPSFSIGNLRMKTIQTDKAPRAIGPYAQAIIANGFIFTSGQIAIAPETNEFMDGPIGQQATQVLENLKHVLEAAGSSMDKALKVTVYLADMDDFVKMNEIYSRYFKNKPARSTVAVRSLPKNAKIEIDAVAAL